jgi:hypothetical protein
VLRGVGKEAVVESKVKIWTGQDGSIERVEDKWDGKLPEGSISEVRALFGVWPVALVGGAVGGVLEWGWGMFVRGCWWWPFLVRLGEGTFGSVGILLTMKLQAFRKLNAVTVPTVVKVPKTEDEDMKMKAEREKA